MTPYTKPPRREFFQAIGELINAVGGYKIVAAACPISIESVNKWKQNPEGNGQDIPVKHLQTLLALAGQQLANLAAQNAADELLQDHFLSLFHRRAYTEEFVFKLVAELQGQKIIKAVNE